MAGFNVNEFRSKVGDMGLLKSSSVMVYIYYGNKFGLRRYSQEFGNITNQIQFTAEATNLPGVSLATTEIRRHGYGVIEKKPYVPIFTDINIVFRSDNKGYLYTFFQTWMKMIINFDGRYPIDSVNGILPGQAMYEIAYKEDYMAQIEIHVLDQHDPEKAPIQIMLTEAYPIFLGEIPLDWQAINSYVKIPIRFTFRDWYIVNKQFTNNQNARPEIRPQLFGPPLNNN